MPSATASRKSASPILPTKSSQMPPQFSLSFSPRRNLTHPRHKNFPASPIFSQLESGDGVNLSSSLSRTLAQFDHAVRHGCLRRQETNPCDPNFRRSSLQVTSKRRRVPSLNRLATFPQNPRASHVRGARRVQTRVGFHIARIPSLFDSIHQRKDATTIRGLVHFPSPNFRECPMPSASLLAG